MELVDDLKFLNLISDWLRKQVQIPSQSHVHNFNLKSCSLMLNPKAAYFLLKRKRKWKQGRTKKDQQGFNILGWCS